MAVSSCCGLHGPRLSLNHRGKWGWGKRFTTASRPGRFQSRHCFQWAAVTRALEFCETQPWACPWAPQLTCSAARSGSGRPRGEGRDPSPTTLSVARTTVKLTEQELCHANALPLTVTQRSLVQTVSRYRLAPKVPC